MPVTPCYPAPVNTPNGVVTIDGKRYQVDLDNRLWRDWFDVLFQIVETLEGTSIQDLSDASLTVAQRDDLTDGNDSALHYHPSDRARANHTGTQLVATISDFNAELVRNPILMMLMAGA